MSAREKEILNSVVEILKKYLHPKKIILFGSRAKGNNKPHSDFDFAVDKKKPDILTYWKIIDEIDTVAGLYGVDVVYLPTVDKGFRSIVLNSGKIIYERKK